MSILKHSPKAKSSQPVDEPPARKRKRRSPLVWLHAKLNPESATVSREDDWADDVPNVKLSRAFAVVLALHVVAIGGFMIYEAVKADEPNGNQALAGKPGNTSASPSTTAEPVRTSNLATQIVESAPVVTNATQESILNDPANAGLQTYVILPGDSIQQVARKFSVGEGALIDRNKLNDGQKFETGARLVIPPKNLVARPAESSPQDVLGGTMSIPSTVSSNGIALNPPTNPAVPSSLVQNTPKVEPKPTPAPPQRNTTPATEKTMAKAEASKTKAPPATLPPLPQTTGDGAKPADKSVAKIEKPKPKPEPVKVKASVHVVKDGETAYRIASKYGVDVNELIRVNGVKPERLQKGMTLTIPSKAKSTARR